MQTTKIKLPKKITSKDVRDAEKSAEKAERELQKILKNEEKAAKKAEMELAKSLKKSANEAARNDKPGNAIKFVCMLIPDTIIGKYDRIPALIEPSGAKHEVVTSPIIENAITFRRDRVFQALSKGDMELHDTIRMEEEDLVIILMYPEELIPKIAAQLNPTGSDTLCMITYVQQLQSILLDKKLTFFFMDLDKYYKKQKRNKQQEYRNQVLNDDEYAPRPAKRKNKNDALPDLSELDIHSALVELQLVTCVNYRLVKDAQELGLHLTQYAKAVADAPFKRQKLQNGFDWQASLDTAGSIKVDKDGVGLKRLWVDQLMQFKNVGIDIAQAIATRYPSPVALQKAYSQCSSLDDGLNLLKDLPVRVGIGPLAKTRKIGPEVSKKVYRFFTCTNGERTLSHSQDIS